MKELLAYKTMVEFLEDRYSRLPSDELGGLLGELILLPDGTPADPAVSADWDRALDWISGGSIAAVVPMRRAG